MNKQIIGHFDHTREWILVIWIFLLCGIRRTLSFMCNVHALHLWLSFRIIIIIIIPINLQFHTKAIWRNVLNMNWTRWRFSDPFNRFCGQTFPRHWIHCARFDSLDIDVDVSNIVHHSLFEWTDRHANNYTAKTKTQATNVFEPTENGAKTSELITSGAVVWNA